MANVKGQYYMFSLLNLTEKVQVEYYESMQRLCADVYAQIEKINGFDSANMKHAYLSQCHSVLDNIMQYLTERKEQFVPYVKSLAEKVDSNHNCSGCVGNCKLEHDIQLFNFSAITKRLKYAQNDIQLLSLPLYSETIFPDQYRVLRNLLALIESDMVELLFLEENYLIPKVAEAQKMINASGK